MRAEVRTLKNSETTGAVPASSILIHAFPLIHGMDHSYARLLVKSQQIMVSADGRYACEVIGEQGGWTMAHSNVRMRVIPFATVLIIGVTASGARIFAKRGAHHGLYEVDQDGARQLEECATYPNVRREISNDFDLCSDDGVVLAGIRHLDSAAHKDQMASWVQVGTERFGPHLFAWNLHLDEDGPVVFNAIAERGILRIVAR